MIAEAQNLKVTFNKLGASIFQIQRNLDATVKVEAVKINSYISEIAELNRAIHANEPGNFSANDLRDKRDKKVKELSELIDLNVVDEMDGQISLTLKNGTPLVLRSEAFTLSTQCTSTATIRVEVFSSQNTPTVGSTVTLTTTLGTIGTISGDPVGTTNAAGVVTAVLTSGTTRGVAFVTATVDNVSATTALKKWK